MTGGFAHLAMLGGLAAVAIPVIIHWIARRDEPVVAWAAMQFLEVAPRDRRRSRLADLLLLLARIVPLALVALALARPFWRPGPADAADAGPGAGARRDLVVIVDGSASMDRGGPNSPRSRAIAWARRRVAALGAGDTVGVLAAGDVVEPVADPPLVDRAEVDRQLAQMPPARGAGDLARAVGEAIRMLGAPRLANPAREVVVLTDGRRAGWRPDDVAQWDLLRDLARHGSPAPSIRVVAFGSGAEPGGGPRGSVASITPARRVVVAGSEVEVAVEVGNAGPGPLTPTVRLEVDGEPVAGSARVVGPISAGGRASTTFAATLDTPGDHLVAARLEGDDEPAATLVRAVAPARVLVIDGDAGHGGGPTRFLRAALAPAGADHPAFRVELIPPDEARPDRFAGRSVVVLADDRPPPSDLARDLLAWADAGGSLVLLPGPGADGDAWARALGRDGLPARLLGPVGDPVARKPAARVDLPSLAGGGLAGLAEGDPALAWAQWFGYRKLEPIAGASVPARFDTGDPWIVERPRGRGRVAVVAAGFDGASGTLVANPDFVPLVHRWFADLGGWPPAPQPVRPGSALAFRLDPAPPPALAELPVTTPSGRTVAAPITRGNGTAEATLASAPEAGVYRLDAPDRPRFAAVEPDPALAAPGPLTEKDRATLAAGWRFRFAGEAEPVAQGGGVGGGGVARRELAPALLLAVLAGLCLEIALTRHLARGRLGAP